MGFRDILNYQNIKVGTLELPDNTSEEVWASTLATYLVSPTEQAAEKMLLFTIKQRKEYAEGLLERFKKRNIVAGINAMQGMWLHHRMRAMDITFYGMPFTIDILNLAISGDIEIACLAIIHSTPDDGSMPFHWFTQDAKDFLINDMKEYLGWA